MGEIDVLAVTGNPAISNPHDQLAFNHALQVNVIGDFLGGGQDLAGKFQLAATQGAAAAKVAFPAEEKPYQLPHGVQSQAARHDGVTGEVAFKEPEVRADIQLGDNLALAELTASVADMRNAVEHEHIGQGQLCIAGAEQVAFAALDQIIATVRALGLEAGHRISGT